MAKYECNASMDGNNQVGNVSVFFGFLIVTGHNITPQEKLKPTMKSKIISSFEMRLDILHIEIHISRTTEEQR